MVPISELDEALQAIEQSSRIAESCIDTIRLESAALQEQQESIILEGHSEESHQSPPARLAWLEAANSELANNLDYMLEARRHIQRLRAEISAARRSNPASSSSSSRGSIRSNSVAVDTFSAIANPIAT